ncbi:MAG: NAD(P)-dependent oxidoreductase [Erysipelotrichaceae bacterium]
MKTGLTSVTFREKSVQEVIALAKEATLDGIEWGGDVHCPAGEINTAKEIKRLCDEAQLEVFSYGSYYKGQEGEDFLPVLQTAVALNAPVIRIWAGRMSPETITEEYFDLLVKNIQDACDAALKENVILGLEYHRRSMTQTKEGAMKLIQAVDRKNLKTYWQPNPEVTFDEQIQELKTIADHLVAMHVFNWDETNTRYLLEEREGIKKWKKYVAYARKYGVDLPLILEFVKEDKAESFMRDVVSLRTILRKPVAVFLGDPSEIKRVYSPDTIRRLQTRLDLSNEVITKDEIEHHLDRLNRCEYLFSTWGFPSLDKETIRRIFVNLEAVFYAAGSVRKFATPYLDLGIQVFSAWTDNAIPVAQSAVAQILLSNKGFFQLCRIDSKADYILRKSQIEDFPGNKDVKVGILGAGSIGRRVLSSLKEQGISTLVYDPYVSDDVLRSLDAKRGGLTEIFATCQTISNHLPDLHSTVGILNYALFQEMKPNATFINTGRGAQVVEEDLVRALQDEPGRIAILDVTYPEPPIEDNPFYTMKNVILTPHSAGSSGHEVRRMGETMCLEFEHRLLGERTSNEVTMAMLETMA